MILNGIKLPPDLTPEELHDYIIADDHPYKVNLKLAHSKGFSKERVAAIQEVGDSLVRLLHRPEHYAPDKDVADIVKGYEYVLQNLWGFDYDADKHRYTMSINGCTCKELVDNEWWECGPIWVDTNCRFHNTQGIEQDLTVSGGGK